MSNKNQKIKYFLYARKSTESEDRQIQSIEDQINRLCKLARELNFEITEIFNESKSAKEPGIRSAFYRMIEKIEDGEAQGILCWKLDRLARNPVDGAKIQWLLQNGTLDIVRTIEREYTKDSSGLLFSVESGMANQYILDLSKNVKRGLQSKLDKGIFPNRPPIGYLNTKIAEKGNNYIIKDLERFDVVRKMWDLMLTGAYTPPRIIDLANNEWGLRTRKTKRIGGVKLCRATIYRIFTNPFYIGKIISKGIEYEGKHEPMITLDEYDKVQILLGKEGRPRPKTHYFPFTGLITCGECGAMITAETKRKHNKKANQIKDYTYYHCTRRKKDIDCSQRKSISAIDLEERLREEIDRFTILPEFKELALEILHEANQKEFHTRTNIYEMQLQALAEAQKQSNKLLELRLKEQVSEEQYNLKREALTKEINDLRKLVKETEDRADNWLELNEQIYELSINGLSKFIRGDFETKKKILAGLGSNFLLKGGILMFEPHPCLIPIIEKYSEIETEYLRLEPTKTTANGTLSLKNDRFKNICLIWRGVVQEVRKKVEEEPDKLNLPKLAK